MGVAYTDEGWWSRNAVAWVRAGDWYIDDGYNTITNLPVLPLLQVGWFKLFGVSLASARAISVICSLLVSALVYLLARREMSAHFAWIAPLVVLTNYPTFAYSRLAILEMPMLVLILVSLLLVTNRQVTGVKSAVAGIVFAIAILLKTTALFALPVIALCIYFRSDHKTRDRLRTLLSWFIAIGITLGIGKLFLMQIGDPQSQAYFSEYNIATKVHTSAFSFLKGPIRVAKYTFQLFPLLFPALFGAIALLAREKKAFSSHLFKIILLWSFGALGAFSLSDFAAHRYFLVLIVPIALVVPLTIQQVYQQVYQQNLEKAYPEKAYLEKAYLEKAQKKGYAGSIEPANWRSALTKAPAVSLLTIVFLISIGYNLLQIGTHLQSPPYTLVETARTIESYVTAEESRSPVLMGNFADTIALINQETIAINDKMGFRGLEYKIKTFDPGYYIARGEIEPRIQKILETHYQLDLLETFELYQQQDYSRPVFFYRLSR